MMNVFWSAGVVRCAQWGGSVIKIVIKIRVQFVDANYLSKQLSGRPRSRGCVTR